MNPTIDTARNPFQASVAAWNMSARLERGALTEALDIATEHAVLYIMMLSSERLVPDAEYPGAADEMDYWLQSAAHIGSRILGRQAS